MKNIATRLLVLLALTLFGTGISFAAEGNGAADGTGPIHDFTACTEVLYTGTVLSCVQYDGLLLEVSEELEPVLISGLGPKSYWEEMEVERPAIDDVITANVCPVEIDGVTVNIAMSISYADGEDVISILLRDEDGDPLW